MDLKCNTRDYSARRIVTNMSFLTAFTQLSIPTSTEMSLLFVSLACWAVTARKKMRQVRGAGLLMRSSKCPLRCSHIPQSFALATEGTNLLTRMRIHCWKKSFQKKKKKSFYGGFCYITGVLQRLRTSGSSSCICQFILSPYFNESLVTSLSSYCHCYPSSPSISALPQGKFQCGGGVARSILLSHHPYQPSQLHPSATRQWKSRIWSRSYPFYLLNAQGELDPSLNPKQVI